MRSNETIPRRFVHQAALHRDRPAVSTRREGVWTYGELDRRAGTIAAALPASPGDRIALLLSHGGPAVAAVLGVLQAGGLYVPLDPAAPLERLAAILAHAEPAAVLTDRRHAAMAAALAGDRLPVIDIDSLSEASPSTLPDVSPDDGCVLFYTAGSTGSPKGVLQSHRGVLHNVANHTDALGLTPADRLTLLSPLTAAASATALFSAVLNGACLCPFAVRSEGLAAMAVWMARERITVYHSVPTLFRHFLESLSEVEPLASLRSLRIVKLGGEPLPRRDLDLFRRRLPAGCRIVNGLGITEAGGNVCHFTVEPAAVLTGATVPVGHPLPGVGVQLLAEDGGEAAPGEIGEIAVRGRYLSLGYWRDPEKTAAAFETLPDGEVRYRTGDLGRLVADGCHEHLGRKDRQVKIRGHRVDLAEVEEALLALPGVREAAVVPCGTESLAAFLVPSAREQVPPPGVLRPLLAARLPEPMIPGSFLILPELPLLPGGKIDRGALAGITVRAAPVQPLDVQDALELQLLAIWRRAFGREIGLADDFFALGGHSLIAAKIATGVQRTLGLDVPLSTLAEAPTIQTFARVLRSRGWTDAAQPLVPLQTGGDRPPFFCVPGAGSDVLSLLALARRLGPDQPFYGLQPRGVDGSRQLHRTVEEMAACFVEHLTAFRPAGSFRLGGSSFGGVVAFEMARQLQQRGREIELLALLDSYGGDYPRRRPGWSLRRLVRRCLRWCLPVGAKEDTSWAGLRRGLRERAQRLRANLAMAFPRLPGMPPVELRFLYLQEVCFRARRRYRPGPFEGRIILFRTERQPPVDLFEADPELGWSGLATAGITAHDVPGSHGLHLREPAVRGLAAALEPYLVLPS